MSRLTKQTLSTYIPATVGIPAFPGEPATPAYCSTVTVPTGCSWQLNPAVTWKYELGAAGYFQWVPYVNGVKIPVSGIIPVPVMIWACTGVRHITTCYPASAGSPGYPGTPPTPSQTIINKNPGWNTSSRSSGKLDIGTYFPINPPVGIQGAFFGVGPSGMDGAAINTFTHGVLVDLSGVKVYENCVVRATLVTGYSGGAEVRIERYPDGSTVYAVSDGATQVSYTSTTNGGFGDLYVYGMIYLGGDYVDKSTCFAPLSGLIYSAGVTLSGAGTLVGTPSVNGNFALHTALSGSGTLSGGGVVKTAGGAIVQPHHTAAMLVGQGTLFAYSTGANGLLSLPAMFSIGGDYAFAFASASIPALYSHGDGGFYVPPTPENGFGMLPAIVSAGIVLESCPGDGDADLAALIGLGGDYVYGFGSTWTPALASYGASEDRLSMTIISSLLGYSPFAPTRDLLIVLNSVGELVSSLTVEIHILAEIMSALLLDDAYTLLGQYDLSLFSSLRGASYQTHPGALDAMGKVWVVNVDTAAAWRYEGYGFNSFFKRGDSYYGVAEDGIYLLEGADDAGVNIDARLDTGRSNFGESKTKTVPSVYLAVASEDVMVLRVEADGQEYFYEARSSSTGLKNHRVDVGRGLEGAHWSFSVLNKAGADFDLANLEFVPILNKRRI